MGQTPSWLPISPMYKYTPRNQPVFMRKCHLATSQERCGQNVASAPPFRGGMREASRHDVIRERFPIQPGGIITRRGGRWHREWTQNKQQAIRALVLRIQLFGSLSRHMGRKRPVRYGNEPIIIHSRIRIKSSSSRVQSMNRTAVYGYCKIKKAARLNNRTKNARLLYQWIRGYTTVWTAASNTAIPYLVNLAHTTGGVQKLSKNLAVISIFWQKWNIKQRPHHDPRGSEVTHDYVIWHSLPTAWEPRRTVCMWGAEEVRRLCWKYLVP